MTAQTGCGSPRAPWIIEVPPGQTIDLWLLDFGALGRHESTLGLGCQQTLGYIVERNLGSNFTICGNHERRKKLYTSKTNKVELNLLSKQTNDEATFLIQYAGNICWAICNVCNVMGIKLNIHITLFILCQRKFYYHKKPFILFHYKVKLYAE